MSGYFDYVGRIAGYLDRVGRLGAGATGLSLILLPGFAQAGWRDWLGLEPKPDPVEDTGLLAGLDAIHLLLILVVVTLLVWASSRPGNIRRGIAEGFGNALGSLMSTVLVSCVVGVIAGVAGMVAIGSYTIATFAIFFGLALVAVFALFVLFTLNS